MIIRSPEEVGGLVEKRHLRSLKAGSKQYEALSKRITFAAVDYDGLRATPTTFSGLMNNRDEFTRRLLELKRRFFENGPTQNGTKIRPIFAFWKVTQPFPFWVG